MSPPRVPDDESPLDAPDWGPDTGDEGLDKDNHEIPDHNPQPSVPVIPLPAD